MTAIAADTRKYRLTLDAVERAVVVLLYGFLVYRFAAALAVHPINGVYLVAEGIVVLMILLRRSTDQISVSPKDWTVAFVGTFLSMMVMPGVPISGLAGVAAPLLFTGFAISLAAKLQLRRSFGLVAANRGLKTRGVYGLVRHPMYLGYFLIQAGMLIANFSAWNIAVIGAWAALQIMRIEAEERILGQDPAYRNHMTRVRSRLFPGLY